MTISSSTVTRHQRRRTGLLWQRDFRLLWTGESFSMIGSEASAIALPLIAVILLDASVGQVGILTASAWLPALLFSLPAGAWVDRVRRRNVMLGAHLIAAGLLLSIWVVDQLGFLTIWYLLATAFGVGICRVFFKISYQAYLPAVVGYERLIEANAWVSRSSAVAEFSGRGIAGAMAQTFGVIGAVVVDAVSYLFAAYTLVRIRAVEPAVAVDPRRDDGIWERIREGLVFVFRDRFLRPYATFFASANLTQGAMQAVLVIWLLRTVGVSPATAAWLVGMMGPGALAGSIVAPSLARRFGNARMFVWAEFFTIPFGLLLLIAPPGAFISGIPRPVRLVVFAVALAALMAGVAATSVIGSAWRQGYVPNELAGRVAAVQMTVVFGALPVGALLGGWTGSLLGLRHAMIVLCVALILPLLVLFFSPIRGRRELPESPESC